ncbi:hypothetical protein GP486_003437 [Trichoglossum hirsutum]|uniref:WD repeat protein n=1 Tax=Trichoglossum hirsutum TaxID=265104 RepID=A0A9P8LD23_9PEZI|nr:hypothetical protein GP486_003437 [Trichoglossum hirsutum]
MAVVLEHESTLSPVTALSLLRAQTHGLHGPLLLAGEGPFLKIYEYSSARVLLQRRIFRSQTVHGIAAETGDTQLARVLLWGGCSIREVEIVCSDDPPDTGPSIRLGITLLPELRASDWILDASFSPGGGDSHVRAALVTAHNSLHLLTHGHQQDQLLRAAGSSSRSILYSAHLLWISGSHILVAAGTVFGEIHVWSCHLADPQNSHEHANEPKVFLHYVLTGHEGSVFGVQISQSLALGENRPNRLLSSCSDDRTIRIWDISTGSKTGVESQAELHTSADTGFHAADGLTPRSLARSKHLVAIGWGHSSRVWGVRFLPTALQPTHHTQQINILSFGEDATCRQWSWIYDEISASKDPLKGHLELTQTYHLHSGKNIWSLAVMTEDTRLLISTGGADGKIASADLSTWGYGTALNQRHDVGWSLGDVESLAQFPNTQAGAKCKAVEGPRLSPELTQNAKQPFTNSFKDYAFISKSDFLATTTGGAIFLCSIGPSSSTNENAHPDNSPPPSHIRFKLLMNLEKLRAYSVLGGDPTGGTAFFSGSDGGVYLYDHSSGILQLVFQVDKKVSGLFPMSSSYLLQVLVTCVGSRKAYLSTLHTNQDQSRRAVVRLDGHTAEFSITTLELPETFIVTSARIVPSQNLLFVGSRSGALAIYDIDGVSHRTAELSPMRCFRRVHGMDAVTAIRPLPKYDGSLINSLPVYILTTGRNGTYAIHQILEERGNRNLTLTTVHISTPPFGPMVEGAYFDPLTHELILFGFRSKNFIVWNESEECEIMNVECGGAHRNWSFLPSLTGNGGGFFVWTKSSLLHLRTQLEDSQRATKSGGHGREIKASALSPPLTEVSKTGKEITRHLLATGAEDTTIRIFEFKQDYLDGSTVFKSLGTFKKHATGIQRLQWSGCGRYLISSGGFEELFIWRVRWISGFGVGVCCEGICPAQAELPDLRIVSFAVRDLCCSPSAGEVGSRTPLSDDAYRYSSRSKTFQLLLLGRYTTCCLSQVFYQHIGNETYILTAGTDGYIALWRSPNLLGEGMSDQTSGIDDVKWVNWQWRFRVHQSTVKSMVIIQVAPHSILAITGGDDNSLALTHIDLTNNNDGVPSPKSSMTRIPKAHASAITAISHVPTTTDSPRILFATSSNDQRLKLWSVVPRSGEGLEIRREGSVETSVPDVSSMVVEKREGFVRVVVCGVGMEGWTLRGVGLRL